MVWYLKDTASLEFSIFFFKFRNQVLSIFATREIPKSSVCQDVMLSAYYLLEANKIIKCIIINAQRTMFLRNFIPIVSDSNKRFIGLVDSTKTFFVDSDASYKLYVSESLFICNDQVFFSC